MISSRGASVICYEAFHENSGKGILKEFYPQEAFGLERNQQGQLIHSSEFPEAYERFHQAEEEYIKTYKMLLNIKQNSDNQNLSTFIPAFEIYHGCDEQGNIVGTTYIWTPNAKLETFDGICEEIHKHPNDNPEHKLVIVLTAMESLVKSICALHSIGMIHRDIKPSNFGFIKRGTETLTQTLSLFDVNTICSVFETTNDIVGTEGYLEPETGYKAVNNQTDIYSIGATLFHAIIVSDEVKKNGFLYKCEYYDRIQEMIDESELIRASEANSHPRLRNILAKILEKSLCERRYRYENCEELLDDLESALYYALPSDIAQKTKSGEKWILTDVEKSLDVNKEKNSFLTIQYHLYKYPLYQYSLKGERKLNILILGFGNYGQKFLDACLQNGQIRNKKLNITVISDDKIDKEIYLSERPELSGFFNIDESLAENEDAYGDVTFKITKIEPENSITNARILRNIIYERYQRQQLHYVFIALGEDDTNQRVAKVCKKVFTEFKLNSIISYVCENKKASNKKNTDLHPLYVNVDIKKSPLYLEIERMAFNVHLIWEKNLNIDYGIVRKNFRKNYNHVSCVSSVITLKYELYSIGIDLKTVGFSEAARKFVNIITDKKNHSIKNELIWMEHRRWVTEKVCLGWQKIRNLEECANGVTKDEKHRRHVCIVRSRPDQKLATEYSINNYYKWDTASGNDLDELDELDRMSVELHRMFEKRAKIVRRQNLLSGDSISGIKTLVEGNKKAVIAFQEWFGCLKNIWNGDREMIHYYQGLKASFIKATDDLSDEKREAVCEQIKAFEVIFYPIIASMEYRDWKKDDVAIIDNIPFILTYTENSYLVIPFAVGNNTNVFGNVAAATVVNPSKIVYLYFIERKQDAKKLQNTIPYIVEYMQKKKLKATIDFVIIYSGVEATVVNNDFVRKIKKLGEGRIRKIKRIIVNGSEGISEKLEIYFKQQCAGKPFFAVEKNATMLSYLLRGAGFYNSFASYKFDSNSMKFHAMVDCDMLEYIKKMPYITVMDMAAFRRSSNESFDQPEFFGDYKELWGKYCERSIIWEKLCNLLRNDAKKNDILASFKKNKQNKNLEIREYHYILPFVCNKSVVKIIEFLKKQNILEEESRVNGYTSDSCEVVIVDCYGYRAEYDVLFSKIYALMLPEAITLHFNTRTHEVKVLFDNLVVEGVQIDEANEEINSLMSYFNKKGYVINYKISLDGKISFTYATRKIKELLTTRGKILEIYTYHKVKELGKFDDVVNSFEIEWEDTEVMDKVDCILTKGFRMLFVECKAHLDIEQNFYFKLSSLTKQFGINATAVLIADVEENSFCDSVLINKMKRKYGDMMDVVTIWKHDEISDIGHTLLQVINGTYVSKEE